MSLSRRELLRRGAVALAAGNIYSLLEALGLAPARAAAFAAPRAEQYLLGGLKVTREIGIEVVVPPLHHRVVTARVRTVGAARLVKAQARLEHALASSSAGIRRLPPASASRSPGAFRTSAGSCRSSPTDAAIPAYLPVDLRLVQGRRARTPAVLDAVRFASDADDVVLGADDVAFLFRSDAVGAHRRAQRRSSAASTTSSPCAQRPQRVRRRRLLGGPGPRQADGARRRHPGAELIVDGVQMFLGFTSTQAAAMAPDRISSFETLRGLTDQKPGSYWSGGAAMHLSHLNEDLERWWKDVPFTRQLAAMTRPGLTVPDKTYTIAEDVTRVERSADVHADLAQFGVVGHSAALQTVTRLQVDTRDAYGVLRPRGTAIVQRADFNTLDNPFAQSAIPSEARRRPRQGCTSSPSHPQRNCSTEPAARWTAHSATVRSSRSTRWRRRRASTRSSTRRTARTSSRRRGRADPSRSSSELSRG